MRGQYKCSVCNVRVAPEESKQTDWNEFNSCKTCWMNKRDHVMMKRFSLIGEVAKAFNE
ncbi:hypothetical protein JOD21_002709 [Jeotgalibacillus terrae]|nr:hypothetical protein [Jeotgalibacillus terrae]